MRENEEQELTIEEFFKLCQQEGGTYQIETPDGWQDIGSLVKKHNKPCYNIILQNGWELECSCDHYLYVTHDIFNSESYVWKKTEDIDVQIDYVLTKVDSKFDTSSFGRSCWQKVVAKEYTGIKDTFDLEVQSCEHRYYANGIVSHNTGKSMTADALASLYEMPLLRLDMGALFSSHVGESESNTRQAISTIEAVAPAILWIDEIEKGLGGVQSSNQTDGGVTSRVFGTLLTWMQEKTSPVFVIATANNISAIPPEFMRAGRFDEIFFLDLPDLSQRVEVLRCILLRKSRNPADFDLNKIAMVCDNYSPAEIEKGVNNALFLAFSENERSLTDDDIITELRKFQPLYNSRKEEIEEMREWALGLDGSGGRARLANEKPSIVKKIKSTPRPIDLSEEDL